MRLRRSCTEMLCARQALACMSIAKPLRPAGCLSAVSSPSTSPRINTINCGPRTASTYLRGALFNYCCLLRTQLHIAHHLYIAPEPGRGLPAARCPECPLHLSG
ncbi:hypothetical protein OH77DRAFT_748644 [Trametes cingulata]|nr:hypothetical protein OH77DRAFT_748644 [Trametes cingulata]